MTKHNHTQNIRRSLKLSALALVAGSALWLSGCDDARNNGSLPQQTKESDGIRYKLVKIEGKTFVATKTHQGDWALAGPID